MSDYKYPENPEPITPPVPDTMDNGGKPTIELSGTGNPKRAAYPRRKQEMTV